MNRLEQENNASLKSIADELGKMRKVIERATNAYADDETMNGSEPPFPEKRIMQNMEMIAWIKENITQDKIDRFMESIKPTERRPYESK